MVAGPNSVNVATPVAKLETENIAIDKAYLLSCTNGRSTDFPAAARVFREAGTDGKPAKIHPGVKLYLAPASLAEQRMSEEAGDWQVLVQSGAELLPAGCATCIGLGRVGIRKPLCLHLNLLIVRSGLAGRRRGGHIGKQQKLQRTHG